MTETKPETKTVAQKTIPEMDAVELAEHIEHTEAFHREKMKHLRALLRCVLDQEHSK